MYLDQAMGRADIVSDDLSKRLCLGSSRYLSTSGRRSVIAGLPSLQPALGLAQLLCRFTLLSGLGKDIAALFKPIDAIKSRKMTELQSGANSG
jgi:hypothetical protein